MKWNDVELVDGKFYVVEVGLRADSRPVLWMYAYNGNSHRGTYTDCYASVRMTTVYPGDARYFYKNGFVCGDSLVKSIRPATDEEIHSFNLYAHTRGKYYNVNVKALLDE